MTYQKPDKITKFLSSLANKFKSEDIHTVFYVMEGDEKMINQYSSFVDGVIKEKK